MSKENEWEDDPDMQEFLEWADQPGPWDEEDDKIHTVGGLTNDKENGFMSFVNKTKMSKEEIKFNWNVILTDMPSSNGSFVGTNYSMTINGKEIILGEVVSSEEEAKVEAIRILKEEYNIDYNPNDVNFTFGGRL